MRVDGRWLRCDDGVVRPTLQAFVLTADETWVELTLLLDGGADKTVFSARFLNQLLLLQITRRGSTQLSGIGGSAQSIEIETSLGFTRDDGQSVTVRGPFAVFVDVESADLSVLGRDVTNNFSVIYDYPNGVVALLAPPHFYEIKST